MDKRSWPWKKKSSDKHAIEKAIAAASDSSPAASDGSAAQVEKAKQENIKKTKYVQISIESYTHLSGLEDQMKSYEEQVKNLEDEVTELKDQLSEAHMELENKENGVKQHAKVAEEAVSGWEKAEAEAAALKNHLESVTLLKLTAEDRASHLDGALKECMRQIRNLKEEHEQKIHELIVNKTKLFDRMKLEFEAKISNLDQELLRGAAENAALSRSLQERSNMLVKINEEKSRAEAEIELLKGEIESCEKEVNSHKYELHMARKEVEIRNEEKNMSVRSAEVANRQHLEGVKKIAKLEAECQRLRGLVRKKLPGPAAMAQMKLEVENLGRDYGDSRLRMKAPSSPHFSDFSLDVTNKYQKEYELLTERLLAMEEETKMLKEALAKRNSELQASRSLCAQTASRLQNLETQIQENGELKSPSRFNPSFTSISGDGNFDNVSCAGSCLSQFKKENSVDSPHKSENTNNMDLMDDFLEMEKLANLSNESNETVSSSDNGQDSKISMAEIAQTTNQELETAISRICDFVSILGKEAKGIPGISVDGDGLHQNLDIFSAKYSEGVKNSENDLKLPNFVLDISNVLSKASELHFNVLGFKTSVAENGSSDCIDKIALPENKIGNNYDDISPQFSDSASDPDTPHDGNLVPTSESTANSWKCSFEEFEQLKLDKENLAIDLVRCTENLEINRSQLVETEQLLAEVKSQLLSAHKANGLAETQLKCMAESYNSLEKRAEELQSKVDFLQDKIECLDNELQEEKNSHQETLDKCKDLQEQLQRIENSAPIGNDDKISQEKDLSAAAEKLAECQETIFLLGKQLKAMRPQTDVPSSPNNTRNQKIEHSIEEETAIRGVSVNLQDVDPSEMDNATSFHMHGLGSESPLNIFNSQFSMSDSEPNNILKSPISSKHSIHRPTNSGSSSSSSTPTPEKQARGFSRFFSSKGKIGQ